MSLFHEIVGPLYPVLDWPMNTGANGGYNFFSGVGGGCIALSLFGGLAKHHNCHHKGCWRPGHRHPEHGWPSCRHHWGETPEHVALLKDF